MSYSWVGAPTEFNGTNEDLGGDSGEQRKRGVELELLVVVILSRAGAGEEIHSPPGYERRLLL